jgi:hypothetical protein
MRRPLLLVGGAALLFALGVVAATTRIAQSVIPVTAYEADVNKDYTVNSGDLLNVALKFGQPVPTATATIVPAPTSVPLGHGESVVLAQGVLIQPGPAVSLGSVDPLTCGHPLFYVTAATTGGSSTIAYFHVLNSGPQSGEWASVQIDSYPSTWLVANFNIGGGHLFGGHTGWGLIPQTFAISVLADARFTVEALCNPALPE